MILQKSRLLSLGRYGISRSKQSRTLTTREGRVPPFTSPVHSGRRLDATIPAIGSHFGSLGIDTPSPKAPAPWQAENNSDVQRVTQNAIIYELTQQQTRTIQSVVPWFLENMPESYFRQVPEKFRMDHIKAISAVKDANMDLYLNLQSHLPDGRQVLTFIRPGTSPGTLLRMVEDFTNVDDYLPLTRLHVFSTKDESMSLNMFVYGNKTEIDATTTQKTTAASVILDLAEQVQRGEHDELEPSAWFERDILEAYLQNCSDNYIRIGVNDPRRFLRQVQLFGTVSGTEGTDVHIDPADAATEDAGHYWVDVAVANSLPQMALQNLCRLLFLHELDVTRARLDVLPDGDNGTVTILRMLVAPIHHEQDNENGTFNTLRREIKRVKWLDTSTSNLVFELYPHLGVTRGEVITAFCALMHPVMAKVNPLAYSKATILETVTKERFIQHSTAIADIFLDRFNPDMPLSDDDYKERCEAVRKIVQSDVEDTIASELLYKMIDIIDYTLKTNAFMPDRYALALRLDPRIMVAPHKDDAQSERSELPYGIVFSHGRRFNGYQVRFRDISRGGLRLVTPKSSELLALEAARQYDECYGLAYAQQLKNKDIPEGGSKAVCLIDTVGMSDTSRGFVMRKSVKAFTDSILDLIVDTEETRSNVVDRYGKKEVLYLGPDEQVIPDDINWVVRRAGHRGYETPAAFMSSKPRAGINHKEFGVTSEGVNVYLDVALHTVLGIDPKTMSFTVKMTGGPDGDVAGNELKILIREYGEHAKVIGIADASGCAEDPDGLDHGELSRLVNMALSIDQFDRSKLGRNGVLHTINTEEGVKARNSMHNRLAADAFIPCGGRPGTIDATNFRHFILPDGKTPSSKLIVEGANMFITEEARQKLFEEAGVVIVKDSSANKGGVITSSYEICAAMLLTEQEFFDNKDHIVDEVLDKLRTMARLEAELLFREFEHFGGSLPQASQIISNCINNATDALSVALDTLPEGDLDSLLLLFRAHLPKTLADLSFERVRDRVPAQYVKNAISSCLASRMVYKEGTKFVAAQPQAKLAKIALTYLEKEKEIVALLEILKESNLPEEEKRRIIGLLEAGGARTALQAF